MTNPSYPRRGEQNLTIQSIGSETLVYDERRHLAFCLDRVASAVWRQCDGSHSVAQIAGQIAANVGSAATRELVTVALAQLEQHSLLQSADVSYAQAGAISRRSLVGSLGVGAALLLPVISMLATPAAAQGYSGCADCGGTPQQGQALQRNGVQVPSNKPATVPTGEAIFKP